MTKPIKKQHEAACYSYTECRDYLQEKYGYEERDYAGHFSKPKATLKVAATRLGIDYAVWASTPFAQMVGKDAELLALYEELDKTIPPYQDFWHWVLANYEVSNGCYVTFTRDKLHEIQEDWVKTIYAYYLNEFADPDGSLTMYVWW